MSENTGLKPEGIRTRTDDLYGKRPDGITPQIKHKTQASAIPLNMNAAKEPAVTPTPPLEQFRRKYFEDKGITRKQAIVGGLSMLGVGTGIFGRGKIGNILRRRILGEPVKPEKSLQSAVISIESTRPHEQLSLEEKLEAVRNQKEGDFTELNNRIEAYRNEHPNLNLSELAVDENGKLVPVEYSDVGIFLAEANEKGNMRIRWGPTTTEDNLARELHGLEEIDNAFPKRLIFGKRIAGSEIDVGGGYGHLALEGTNRTPWAGEWILPLDIQRGPNGKYLFLPDYRLAQGPDMKQIPQVPSVPSIGGNFADSLSLNAAQEIISNP